MVIAVITLIVISCRDAFSLIDLTNISSRLALFPRWLWLWKRLKLKLECFSQGWQVLLRLSLSMKEVFPTELEKKLKSQGPWVKGDKFNLQVFVSPFERKKQSSRHYLRFVPGTSERKEENLPKECCFYLNATTIDKRLSFTFYVPSTITTTNLLSLRKKKRNSFTLNLSQWNRKQKSINRKSNKMRWHSKEENKFASSAKSVACSKFHRIRLREERIAMHCLRQK